MLIVAFLLFVFGSRAETASHPNNSLTPLQRLERQHLQAVNEARLRFARERHRVLSNGVYDDFRAILLTGTSDAECAKASQPELLAAARKAGVRVVLKADQQSSASTAWRGLHDDVLFISGMETTDGTLSFPECGEDGKPIADSGIRFLSNPRSDAPTEGLIGMVINDRRAETTPNAGPKQYLAAADKDPNLWRNATENYRAFPDEFFAAGSDYPLQVLAKWDQESEKRPFTAIGAGDPHQNLTLRGTTFDPSEVSFRNLVTHLLARDLTEPLVREALTNGHAYIAHDWLCDPSGFSFGAVNNLGVFTMGDPAPLLGRTRVTAMLPIPARLRLFHKGTLVQETTGTNLNFEATEVGPYRLEAWLTVDGEDRPWIYSNPVYLRKPGPGDMRLPSTELSAEVERHKDIVYQEGPEEDAAKHKLDIYVPKGKSNIPVLFFIHGGSWRSGDRSNYPPLGNRFAHDGYITVVPSYRLAPKHPHPAQIEDVAAAFAWTARHISEYAGDTNRIYVAGHSAGGHLAALLSLDGHYLADLHVSPKLIHGVLALSGVYNLASSESQESVFGKDPQIRRDASPLHHVRADAPPFLVTYCQWDYFSLPAPARAFHRALQQAGVKTELVYVPRESHISEIVHVSNQGDPTATAALKFMQ